MPTTYPPYPPTAPSISWTYKATPYNPYDVYSPCCIVNTPSPCTCPTGSVTSPPTQYHANYVPSTTAVNLVKRYTECILQSYRYQLSNNPVTGRELSFRIGYRRMAVPWWDPATTVAPFLPSIPGYDPSPDPADAPQGLIITQDIADRWLWNDLCQIAKNLNGSIIYPLHQNQLDGLVSFIYSGGSFNNVMATAVNNVQLFQGKCFYTNPSPPHQQIEVDFVMSQWDPILNVAGAEILKYVYFRGNKIQSLVDRRYEEWNLFTGQSLPYTIPGSSPVSPNLVVGPYWGQCAVHQINFANVFGETSTGVPYWKGSYYP